MVWADLKKHVASRFCQNYEDALRAVEEFRLTLTPQKCQNYIKSLKKVKKFIYFSF